MAANTSPIFTLTPRADIVTFVNGDGTTAKTLFTPGSDGSRIDAIRICSDDTSDVDMGFYINDGSDRYIGNVRVTAGSGYTTILPVEALATLLPDDLAMTLPSNRPLKCAPVSAVTSGKTVTITAIGGDY